MESLAVSVENLGKLKRKLQITVPMEAVRDTYDKTYKTLINKISIPGFRKGHYPRALLEKRFKKQMSQDALETLVPEYFEKALKQENMKLVGRPHFADLEVDKRKPLVFTATFELQPAFELPDYSSFRLERRETEITREDIDAQRKSHLNRAATYRPTDEPAADGDRDAIDCSANPENEHVPPKENFQYLLGSKTLEPEVDEALVGMKSGEEKSVTVKYAEDCAVKELQGTSVAMVVRVNEVERKTPPEMNEEFFSRFSGVKSEEDFESYLKREAAEIKEYENSSEYRKGLKAQLADRLDFELPERILAEEVDFRKRRAEESGTDDTENEHEVKKKAEEELRFSFYIQRILEREEITIEDEEVAKRFRMNCLILGLNPGDLIKQEYGRQMYRQTQNVIAEEMALDFVTKKIFES